MAIDKIVFFDTETGSIAPCAGALLTMAACIYDVESDTLNETLFSGSLRWERYSVQARALEINRLNLVDVYNQGLPPNIFLMHFQNWLDGVLGRDTKILLGGHNTHFDVGHLMFLIDHAMERSILEAELEDLTRLKKRIQYRYVDTSASALLLQSAGLYPVDQSVSLPKLCKFFEVPLDDVDLHTASADALATANVYRKMIKRIANA